MKIQWLGHASFKLFGENATVLIDPFLTGSPVFSGSVDDVSADVTHILLTHGHNDHVGDTVGIMQKTGATLISTPELTGFLGPKAGENAKAIGMNIGGTATQDGFSVSMVQAFHSSSFTLEDGSTVYGGMPTGLVIKIDGKTIYHMGDTGIFSDMALINEMYKPEIGIVPMGGHFTMDADGAALAVNRYFDFEKVIPCHYLTFPLLAQSPDAFKAAVKKGDVLTPKPMDIFDI